MPVYNAENYLQESIQSVLSQSFKEFDFFIIDDGSNDNSNLILQNYIYDPRIKLITLPQNKGLINALNLGLKEINSKYIIRMDADDLCHPDRFKILFHLMEENPDTSILGSSVLEYSKPFPTDNFPSIYLNDFKKTNAIAFFNSPILHPTVIIRCDFLKEKGLFYDSNYIHAEDNALWLDSIKKGRVTSIDYPLLKYRRHRDQISNIHKNIQHANSTKKRVHFLESVTGLKLSKKEIKIYRAISYKYNNLELSDFINIKEFISKFEKSVINQKSIEIDQKYLSKILYKKVSLLFLRNSHLGFPLLFRYLKYFVFNFKICISFKLIRRIIYGV